MESILACVEIAALIIEVLGIIIIVAGIGYSLVRYLIDLLNTKDQCFDDLRKSMAKSIIIGLEVLIAADIIASIMIKPDLNAVIVLGLIVLIRTVLSLSLQVELEGRFPWQRNGD